MIQPLRIAHRRAFGVLAVTLPVVLFAGLAARHPRPTALPTAVPAPGALVKKAEGLWGKHEIGSEFYQDTQHTYVELWPARGLEEPDLLLYWAADNPQNTLAADARLLGTFAPGKFFALPETAGTGYLVLYSLGHQSVVDTAALEKTP